MATQGAPQVTKDDQQRINLFGRLNIKFKELQEKVKAKKVRRHTRDPASLPTHSRSSRVLGHAFLP